MLNPFLTKLMVEARIADLHTNAAGSFPARAYDDPPPAGKRERGKDEAITIRIAGPADETMLGRLAQLDSAEPPTAPVLIAEIDGVARAALSLDDGAVIANPFHRTLAAQQLLLARAAQLRGDRRVSRRRRLLDRARARKGTTRRGAAVSGPASQSQP
jgi:hypothetical protein